MSLKLHSDPDHTDPNIETAQGKAGKSAESKSATKQAQKVHPDASGEEMPSQAETLDYLIALTIQIKKMAERAGFRRLGLILMLAEQEARQQMVSNDSSPPKGMR